MSGFIQGPYASPVVEEGAMIVDGIPQESKGDVISGKNNTYQSFVSVKKGFKEDSHTYLGDNNYFSSFVNIGHNCRLGNNNFLAPGAKLAGGVTIGNHVYIGMNVSIVQDITIGDWVKIAAGNVIRKNVPSNTYVDIEGRYRRNETAKILSGNGRTT